MATEMTLEAYILQIDNHLLGFNGYEYYNEACKEEDLQLRTWLQELRVRRRSCKTYSAALRKVNPKTEEDIIKELIKENEELKAQYKHAEYMIQRAERSEKFMEYMSGDKQVIMVGEIAGVPFKIKIDSYLPPHCGQLHAGKDISCHRKVWYLSESRGC
mgnify:CR=1 FL=1